MMDAATKAVIADIHARRGVIGEQIAALRKEDADLETTLRVMASLYSGEDAGAQPVAAGPLPEPEPMPEPVRAYTPAPAPRIASLVDAATLPPITNKQANAFRAIMKLSQGGKRVALKQIANEIGAKHEANITGFVKALAGAGYIENRGDRFQTDWHPIAYGEP